MIKSMAGRGKKAELIRINFDATQAWVLDTASGGSPGSGLRMSCSSDEGRLWGWEAEGPIRIIGRTVILWVCVVVGGWIGLSRLKLRLSARARRDGPPIIGSVTTAGRRSEV